MGLTDPNDSIAFCFAPDGRLGGESLRLLRAAGLDTGPLGTGSRIGSHRAAEGLLLVAARGSETAWLTGTSACDVTMAGSDQVNEFPHNLIQFVDLKFGKCTLEMGVPQSWTNINAFADVLDRFWQGPLRIATEHPLQVARWIQGHAAYRRRAVVPPTIVTRWHTDGVGSPVEVVLSGGETETKGILYDDCVVDLVGTGNTMTSNWLKRIEVLDPYVTARLIASRSLMGDEVKWQRVIQLAQRIAAAAGAHLIPVVAESRQLILV